MKTIEQLSQKTKDTVVQILADGVTFDSVQTCVAGISSDNIGVETLQQQIEKFEDIRADVNKYNRVYAEQALTIFGRFAAQPMAARLEEMTGVKLTEEQIENKIQETVAVFLPKVTI